MKRIVLVFCTLLVGGATKGQSPNNKMMAVFEVKHYDYFTFEDSEPREKGWEFNLEVTLTGVDTFQACYQQELVDCLYHCEDLRKTGIRLNTGGICFTYTKMGDNTIQVLDKKEVLDYLNQLSKYRSSSLKRKQTKQTLRHIRDYLADEAWLDQELSRELKVIHEYDDREIPIGVAGLLEEEEEKMNLNELTEEEIQFMNQTDWEKMGHIRAFRTPILNEQEFVFDYLYTLGLLSSDNRPDFEAIMDAFFDGRLNLEEHEDATLNRAQRFLNKKSKKLSYYLHHRRTKSETMNKITRLEIQRK